MGGRSARRRISRTSTSTSRRMLRSRAMSSIALGRPTTRRTTPACGRCRRCSRPRCGTATRRPRTGCSRSCSRTRGGDGIGPMGGPAYVFDSENHSPFRFPRVFDGHPIFYEWTRDYFKVFELNRPQRRAAYGRYRSICSAARRPPEPERRPGQPDGHGVRSREALYTLEYGTGSSPSCRPRSCRGSTIVRSGQYTPIVQASATPTSGHGAAVDGQVLQRGHDRPRRRPTVVRVGLPVRRHGRLHPGQPDVHLHGARRLRGHAAGDRSDRPLGVLAGARDRRQPGAAGHAARCVERHARRSTSATRSTSR